jgi:large subunit ribosomal protein L3
MSVFFITPENAGNNYFKPGYVKDVTMKPRLMGRKKGMTQIFDEQGSVQICTVIHIEPNVVSEIKTKERDGYQAVQIGFEKVKDERADKRYKILTRAERGHFDKSQVKARRHLNETRLENTEDYSIGQEMGVELFEETKYVDVIGTSKGKGFQGVMKKFGFSGGPASHGSGFHRHAGSTGMRSTPGRCFPGGKRPSRMGGKRVTTQNLEVIATYSDKQVILVRGAVPGPKNALVYIQAAVKKQAIGDKS